MLEKIFQVSRSLHTISNSIRFSCARVFIRCEHCAYVCIFKYVCVCGSLYNFYSNSPESRKIHHFKSCKRSTWVSMLEYTHNAIHIYEAMPKEEKKNNSSGMWVWESTNTKRGERAKTNKKPNKREKRIYNTIRNLTNKSETQTRNGEPSW